MADFWGVISLVAFIVAIALTARLTRPAVSVTRRALKWVAGWAVTCVATFVFSILSWTPANAAADLGGDGTPLESVAGYTQTWPKPYSQTSCDEFSNAMSSPQRFAAAADMLTIVWMKIETTHTSPSDVLIQQYQDAIVSGCLYPEEKIVEVAWSAWINDPRFSV